MKIARSVSIREYVDRLAGLERDEPGEFFFPGLYPGDPIQHRGTLMSCLPSSRFEGPDGRSDGLIQISGGGL